MDELLITIVVPVRNRAGLVERTLNSIAAQTERPLRLIVVDNASTDTTPAVVAEWAARHAAPDFQIDLLCEPTVGAAAARNCGLAQVASRYVMFFDSDDEMLPSHVSDLADELRRHPELDIVGRDVELYKLNGRRVRLPFADRDLLFAHAFCAILSTQRYAIRTDLIRGVGGWQPSAAVWNDYELGFRLLAASPRVSRIDSAVTVKVMAQRQSITGIDCASRASQWEHTLDLCEATLKVMGADERIIDLRRITLAAAYRREGAQQEAVRLLAMVTARCRSAIERAVCHAAYHYTRLGGRGIHRILRLILLKKHIHN